MVFVAVAVAVAGFGCARDAPIGGEASNGAEVATDPPEEAARGGSARGVTERESPSTDCPEGTGRGSACRRCGPMDGCESLFSGCLRRCVDHDECDAEHPMCVGGLCTLLCG